MQYPGFKLFAPTEPTDVVMSLVASTPLKGGRATRPTYTTPRVPKYLSFEPPNFTP